MPTKTVGGQKSRNSIRKKCSKNNSDLRWPNKSQ